MPWFQSIATTLPRVHGCRPRPSPGQRRMTPVVPRGYRERYWLSRVVVVFLWASAPTDLMMVDANIDYRFFLLTLFDKCLGLRKGASLSRNLWEEWKTFCFSLDSVRWIATKGNDKADFLVERTMRWDWFIAVKTWQNVNVWMATTIVVVHKLDWRVKKTVYSSEMLRFTLAVHLFTVMMELHLRLFTLVNI